MQSKVIIGTAMGFAVSYGVWGYQRMTVSLLRGESATAPWEG